MRIVKYETEIEAQQIIQDMTSEGLLLTNVSNVTEGNFLGFMSTPIQTIDNTPETLLEIRNNTDLLLLKQEGIL